MSVFAISVVGFHILLPVLLLGWLALGPARSRLLFVARAGAVLLFLLVLCLIPIWLVPPWWIGWIYVAAAAAIVLGQSLRGTLMSLPLFPASRAGLTATAALFLVSAALALPLVNALSGRAVPEGAVDIAFPLGPGRYLVASGGTTSIINGHLMTLEPSTDRQRAYRGQSYAVDLIGIDRFGLRTEGLRPADPAAYAIFGRSVHAPCRGEVLSAVDGFPDMPVPETDTSLLEGNHVFIDCGGFGVLLAHLRNGSVQVGAGDTVTEGDHLGEAGNSGQSTEPHLHVHAQQIPEDGPLLSGEPLFLTLNGRFLVRNDRITVREDP